MRHHFSIRVLTLMHVKTAHAARNVTLLNAELYSQLSSSGVKRSREIHTDKKLSFVLFARMQLARANLYD